MELVWPSSRYLPGYVAALEANGGVLQKRFVKPAQYGSTPGLRYRIVLP